MRILWILIVSALCTSCRSGEDSNNPYLVFYPSAEKATVVPTDKYSCDDLASAETSTTAATESVKASSAIWNNIYLEWNDTARDLYIAYISVEFNSSLFQGGKFKTVLSSDEVDALFGVSAGRIRRSTVISSSSKSSLSSDGIANCGLSIGSITTVKGAQGEARGTLKLVGTAVNDSGVEEVVQESTPVVLKIVNFD